MDGISRCRCGSRRGILRIREVSVDCRRRIGGESKVSGNLRAALKAALVIVRTFLRLAATLRAERVT